MVGLEYLHRVLAENGEPVCLAQRESGPRETLSAVSLGKLKATAKDLEDRSSAAWKRGDKAEYNRLVLERVALPKYQSECFAPGGRRKFFETAASREQAASARGDTSGPRCYQEDGAGPLYSLASTHPFQ
jgi:hypothetical protein